MIFNENKDYIFNKQKRFDTHKLQTVTLNDCMRK